MYRWAAHIPLQSGWGDRWVEIVCSVWIVCVCVCSLCFIKTLAAWVTLEKTTKFMVVCIRIIPNKVWKWVSQYSVLKYGKNPGTTRVMECSGLKYSSTNAKVPSSVPGVDTNPLRVASVRPLVIKICLWISSFYTPLSSCLYKSNDHYLPEASVPPSLITLSTTGISMHCFHS